MTKRFEKYLSEKNMWRKITGTKPMEFPLSEIDIAVLVDSIGSDLSPENLHCDGEISVSSARSRGKVLMGVYNDIVKYGKKNGLTVPQVWY